MTEQAALEKKGQAAGLLTGGTELSPADDSITNKFVDFALGTTYEELSPLSKAKARDALIDFMGCVIGAGDTSEAAIIEDFIDTQKSLREATVIGSWKKSSALYAAMANAYKCHILEFDDGVCGFHTGATILPAAIAAAEKIGASGKELLRAIVLGIDFGGRVCLAAGISQNKYWHSTGTCGVLGAAMAAGLIMGLSKQQLVWALGNAGTMAAGLWEFNREGAMSKYIHCGKAAYDGLLACELAKLGFTGAERIIEGEKGFIVSHSTQSNPERFFNDIGSTYMIERLSPKPFPSCSHTHAAITASLRLRTQYRMEPEQIDKIIITTYQDAVITARHNKKVSTPREARFSLAGCAAAALLWGNVDKQTFSYETIRDPVFTGLVSKTEIRVDAELTKMYPPDWPAIVEVVMKSGERYRNAVYAPWGDVMQPMPKEVLKKKYMALMSGQLSKDKAEELYQRCYNVENIPNLTELFSDIDNKGDG